MQQALERSQGRISARKNGLEISPSSFCRIIKKFLRWYPYKMIRHHNLKDGGYERRSSLCQWFLHQLNNRRFLANFGDEVGFVSTLQRPMFPSYRNQSVNFQSKLTDCFLYDGSIGR